MLTFPGDVRAQMLRGVIETSHIVARQITKQLSSKFSPNRTI